MRASSGTAPLRAACGKIHVMSPSMKKIDPDRGKFIVIITAVIAVFPLMAWMVLPAAPAGFGWDETWYLWMAEWFSPRPDDKAVALSMLSARQYPALFPYLLSWTGDVSSDFSNGLLMNAALLCLGAGVTMYWLMREGMAAAVSVVAGLLLILNPVSLGFSWLLMSEPLFILLTTLALLLAARREPRYPDALAIGLLAGLAIATRSAGWALVLGLLAHLVLGRKVKMLPLWLAGLLLGLLVHLWLRAGLPEAHSYWQGFQENLARVDVGYLVNQLSAMADGWVRLWGSVPGALLMAAWVLPGFLLRLRGARADACYILVTGLMLVAWPFPGQMDRFLWVLIPALLVCGQTTVMHVEWMKSRGFVGGVVVFLVLALSVPDGLGRNIDRLLHPPGEGLDYMARMSPWTRTESRDDALMTLRASHQLLEDVRRIPDEAADSGCVYSEYPALVSIQSGRVAFASPWNTLQQLGATSLACPYYYLVPDALPGVTKPDIEALSAAHQELFRSSAPYDPSGQAVLGVFYRLNVTESH
jgi:hypothetical protein